MVTLSRVGVTGCLQEIEGDRHGGYLLRNGYVDLVWVIQVLTPGQDRPAGSSGAKEDTGDVVDRTIGPFTTGDPFRIEEGVVPGVHPEVAR